MIVLGQASAGAALVLCFILLRTSKTNAACLLLLAQSVAVALGCCTQRDPLGAVSLAASPLILAGMVWLVRDRPAGPGTMLPVLGKPGVGMIAGTVLAILSQSQGRLAEPLAIVLLGILIAATRPPGLMHLVALVVVQNGVVLAAAQLAAEVAAQAAGPALAQASIAGIVPGTVLHDALPDGLMSGAALAVLPVACLGIAAPLALGMIFGHLPPAWHRLMRHRARQVGWARVILAGFLFAATLTVPLDLLAAVFAPLLGFEGLLRAWAERRRVTKVPLGHLASLLQLACTLAAVALPDPFLGCTALFGALAAAALPRLQLRWTECVLAFSGAGLCLLGLLAIGAAEAGPDLAAAGLAARTQGSLAIGTPGLTITGTVGTGVATTGPTATGPMVTDMMAGGAAPVGYLCLFAGLATVAAMTPELAAPILVLVLRRADTGAWPPVAACLAGSLAILGLLTCSALLLHAGGRRRVTLLQLGQLAVAALAIATNRPDGRYAATVLLILLTLTRASRLGGGPAATFATSGLSGLPPFGVFPAMVLVALALCGFNSWLLLPFGLALAAMVPAALPARLPRLAAPSVLSFGWLPLALAFLFGFFTPEALAHWLRLLTAGPS